MRAPVLTLKRARRLRRDMSLPEVLLWRDLRAGRLDGLAFRRQHPIGPYILDFYCSEARLAVEIDGFSHAHPDQARHDEARSRWLEARGVRVLRFAAADVLDDRRRAGVIETIAAVARGES